jgi:hypothetical protein
VISPELWEELRPRLSDEEAIEVCLLVGHYEMLAMTLNSLDVQQDPLPDRPSRLARLARRAASRRGGANAAGPGAAG